MNYKTSHEKSSSVFVSVCLFGWAGGGIIILDSVQMMTGKFKCIFFFACKRNNQILNGFTVYIKMEMKMLPMFTSTCRFLRQQIANEC